MSTNVFTACQEMPNQNVYFVILGSVKAAMNVFICDCMSPVIIVKLSVIECMLVYLDLKQGI